MKTNIFRVKEKKEKKIVIEEERTKNPLLLFFLRHRKIILLILMTLLVLSLLISIGLALSIFQGSNDYDISYIDGSDQINSNDDPNIKDDDVKNELLGEIARSEGVVVLVETFMSPSGDVVSYYTDGTAIIVHSDGKIHRVSPNKDGTYGVNRNGQIADSVKRVLVESTTSTLADGTIITYYSDGTAKIELKAETIFIRDSEKIKIDAENRFVHTTVSGVALTTNTQKIGNDLFTKFTDNTSYIIEDGKKKVVNKNRVPVVGDQGIDYDKYNSFDILGEKTYRDGRTITIFGNGSATITDKDGNIIFVKKSGDILLKSKKLYEIIPNDYGFSMSTITTPDGKRIVYYDNGSAVIIYPDGTREYVADNDDVIYDSEKNIISNPEVSKLVSEKTTTNGETAYNFDNGKSQVIRSDGSSYIIDTDKLNFKSSGDVDTPPSGDDGPTHGGIPNPGEGIYISEAENKYNDFQNVEDTSFIIRNNNNQSKLLRITIQEVTDYRKYNTSRLDPQFVKFQATVGDTYIPTSKLTENVWRDSNGVLNYVIYEGRIQAKATQNVALALYVDYAPLDNSYQNKGFIGTIKIYVEDGA